MTEPDATRYLLPVRVLARSVVQRDGYEAALVTAPGAIHPWIVRVADLVRDKRAKEDLTP